MKTLTPEQRQRKITQEVRYLSRLNKYRAELAQAKPNLTNVRNVTEVKNKGETV